MCGYKLSKTGNKLAKFHLNTLSLSGNIAKSFRGYFFDSHCIIIVDENDIFVKRKLAVNSSLRLATVCV